MSTVRRAAAIVAAAACTLTCSRVYAASYQYYGNPFTDTDGKTSASSINFYIYTTSALSVGKHFIKDISEFGYWMNDGALSLASYNSSLMPSSFITVGVSGTIDSWQIAVLEGVGRSFVLGDACCTTGDYPVLYTYAGQGATDASIRYMGSEWAGYAFNNQRPGNWIISSVPEPATVAYLVAGLAVLARSFRRRATPQP